MPSALAMAATWDPEAVYLWGSTIGQEFHKKGTQIALGPGMNVNRIPQGGRAFEYLTGEDPYLGFTLTGQAVKGIQDNHVMAVAKHFALNNQETDRMEIDERADERTRFELYYPPFEGAIKAGVGAIMCSYNKINGEYACASDQILNQDLRNKLGFKGFVMSDWTATKNATLANGLD